MTGQPIAAPHGPASVAHLSHTSIDGSRFAPGVIVADRYRIVGQLGKGGMGEVYRADDLKLGQPVALKFLPEHLAYNRVSLDRLFNEVRIARAVSHPNVCRVHDIGEVDDVHFLSMEYVDGEDLATLLRRIGRLPTDKALQIARQLCAGLAAAHDRSVLHRDLKPANVMIDGQGAVRITDFGLAGLAAELRSAGRAGTPAYMAPEQFAGSGVSARSDIYALGLVLYEVFTGKPVYRPESMEHLSRLHQQAPPALSSIVPDIDPRIERVILRCLERDPALRPRSAIAVSAALPGGDPLAEALAAGETPSPELVAASGERGSLRPQVALALLLTVTLALVLLAAVNSKTKLFARVPLELSREALTFGARQVLEQTHPDRKINDSASGFAEDRSLLDALAREAAEAKAGGPNAAKRFEELSDPSKLATGRPPVVTFWYRESPKSMTPREIVSGVSADDPPMSEPGMKRVVLDVRGRLVQFLAIPEAGLGPRSAEPEPPAPSIQPANPSPDTVNWDALLESAKLEPRKVTRVDRRVLPPVFSDQTAAFEGFYPDRPDLRFRVEAAALYGRPVYFSVTPADLPMAIPDEDAGSGITNVLSAVFLLTALFAVPGGMAVVNIRRGRGDRRGAFRLALVLFVAVLAQKILGMHYSLTVVSASDKFLRSLGDALLTASLAWLCYIAIEPIIRRQRPETIIAWSRLMSGSWKDPLVGRDILLGCAIGCLWPLMLGVIAVISPSLGIDRPSPQRINPETLAGLRSAAAVMLGICLNAFLLPLVIALLEPVAAKFIENPLVSRIVQYTLLSIAFLAVVTQELGSQYNPLVALLAIGAGCGCGYIASRYGLLLLVAAFFSAGVLTTFPVALGLPAWLAGTALAAMVVIIGLAAFGFMTSLAGRKVFSPELLGN